MASGSTNTLSGWNALGWFFSTPQNQAGVGGVATLAAANASVVLRRFDNFDPEVTGTPNGTSTLHKSFMHQIVVEEIDGGSFLTYIDTLLEIEQQCLKSIQYTTLKRVKKFPTLNTIQGLNNQITNMCSKHTLVDFLDPAIWKNWKSINTKPKIRELLRKGALALSLFMTEREFQNFLTIWINERLITLEDESRIYVPINDDSLFVFGFLRETLYKRFGENVNSMHFWQRSDSFKNELRNKVS